MRKFLIMLLLCMLCLVSCTQKMDNNFTTIESFTYADDFATYVRDDATDTPWVKTVDFKNKDISKCNDAESAVMRAKDECTISYDSIYIAFDDNAKIWKVDFYTASVLGGDQCVYLNTNGITQLIVYGE